MHEAYVFAYAIGLHGEKQCLENIRTKMKEKNGKIYILFNGRYHKMHHHITEKGTKICYILIDSLEFTVITYV